MIVDTFRNFIEIMGLRKKELELLKEIAAESKRISVLADKRSAIKHEIEQLKKEQHDLKIKELELEISNLGDKITHYKVQINQVKNDKELNSINKEIVHHEDLLKALEEKYFSSEARSEEIDSIVKDHNNFLTGSEQTLSEIESEVKETINIHENEINNCRKRIDALLDQENPSNKKLFLEVNKRFLNSTPFAHLLGKNCQMCRINIDVQTAGNVENFRAVEMCPSCGRILLPSQF